LERGVRGEESEAGSEGFEEQSRETEDMDRRPRDISLLWWGGVVRTTTSIVTHNSTSLVT
jgi:hypothetical protein